MTSPKKWIFVISLSVMLLSGCQEEPEKMSFNQHIRPILSDNCFFCHGPDAGKRKAELRLDVREVAIAKGAIVPGAPDSSELIRRIYTADPDDIMPKPGSHKVLTDEQKARLALWIEQGAEYDIHWSYKVVQKPEIDGIDATVKARLEHLGLEMSEKADKRTLIRRVYLDLIGLPPAPEEVDAFLADDSPEAYEKVVDRLLASKHYGERMAIAWLDAVRYADTIGYHSDLNRDASPYRDYVIKAFNDNKPFDQFTIEQLAGDLLPDATVEQKVAASYNRLNQISEEGGIQDKEYIKKYQAERVRTTATAWMGATMACAECHDHKFDPFTSKDFYSFASFFADILEKGAWNGDGKYQEDPEKYLEDESVHEGHVGPELKIPNATFLHNPDEIRAQIDSMESSMAKGTPRAKEEFEEWIEHQRALQQKKLPQYIEFEDKPYKAPFSLKRYPRLFENAVEIAFEAKPTKGSPGLAMHLVFDNMDKTEERVVYWGVLTDTLQNHNPQIRLGDMPYVEVWSPIRIPIASLDLPDRATPVSIALVHVRGIEFQNIRFRTLRDGSRFGPLGPESKEILSQAIAGEVKQQDLATLRSDFYINHAEHFAGLREHLLQLRESLNGFRYTPCTISAKPREVRILPRGNWMDENGELVLPATPGFLPNTIASTDSLRMTRQDLAKWLVNRQNPLTARAIVNRIWAMFFGEGLSNTPEDLGRQGEYPEYPELLEWLAAEFMDSGWDVKHMVRTIVRSHCYQQGSETTPELDQVDPYNRLLARQSPRRLPAELIRDNALAISGLINLKVGGRSVKPYQPEEYYEHLNFPPRRYVADHDENQYRRGLYTHWQRTFLHPMMLAFDALGREECMVERPLSNTPLQALNLLNDPTHVEAARALGATLLTNFTDDQKRIEYAYQKALGRQPRDEELVVLSNFLDRERERFDKDENQTDLFLNIGIVEVNPEASKTELAALTSMSRAVLNLHETITRY
jgi:hypothetical protein